MYKSQYEIDEEWDREIMQKELEENMAASREIERVNKNWKSGKGTDSRSRRDLWLDKDLY